LTQHGENSSANRLAKVLLSGDLPNPFTVRELYRKNIHGLTDRKSAQAAVDEFTELGWLYPVETPATFGQKRKIEYAINPKISTKLAKGTDNADTMITVSALSDENMDKS
jgi:hypothetical protein